MTIARLVHNKNGQCEITILEKLLKIWRKMSFMQLMFIQINHVQQKIENEGRFNRLMKNLVLIQVVTQSSLPIKNNACKFDINTDMKTVLYSVKIVQ